MSTCEQIEIARGLSNERLIELFSLYVKGEIICKDAMDASITLYVLKQEMLRRMGC